jgi:hypothetical protein
LPPAANQETPDETANGLAIAAAVAVLASVPTRAARSEEHHGWGDYGDHHEWHDADWWHAHSPGWMWEHHPEWAEHHPHWRHTDGDWGDHHLA